MRLCSGGGRGSGSSSGPSDGGTLAWGSPRAHSPTDLVALSRVGAETVITRCCRASGACGWYCRGLHHGVCLAPPRCGTEATSKAATDTSG